MEYNLKNLIENAQKFSKDDFLFFWRTGKAGTVDKGCLSQWYMSDFIIDGQSYCCAEQYMMAMKALLFNDVVVYKEIMKSRSPRKD